MSFGSTPSRSRPSSSPKPCKPPTIAGTQLVGGGVRMLDYREWNNVTVYALGLSDILLGDFLFKGRELSREVDARIRGKKFDGWEGYWPSGFHIDRVRALVTDTAWPTPGYTSTHGVTHIQDFTTQLLLAVCHLTKEKDTQKVTLTLTLTAIETPSRP